MTEQLYNGDLVPNENPVKSVTETLSMKLIISRPTQEEIYDLYFESDSNGYFNFVGFLTEQNDNKWSEREHIEDLREWARGFVHTFGHNEDIPLDDIDIKMMQKDKKKCIKFSGAFGKVIVDNNSNMLVELYENNNSTSSL